MRNRIAAIYKLGQRVVQLRDPRQIAEAVLDTASKVLKFQYSEFLLVDEARRELIVTARQGQIQDMGDVHLPLDSEQSISAAAARNQQVVYIPDVQGASHQDLTSFSTLSELAVPVLIGDHTLGVVTIKSLKANAFDQTAQEILLILADQAALALENARLHASARRLEEELRLVNRVTKQVNASLDLRVILDVVVETVAEQIPCSLAEISLWDQSQQLLVLEALHCEPNRTFPIGRSYPPGHGYTGWLVRNKQPLLVQDAAIYEDIKPDLLPGEMPFRSYLGLPLLAGDELIGTLVLVHDQPGAFYEEDLNLLKSLSEQAALAIRNARLYKELNGLYQETSRQKKMLEALTDVAAVINQLLPLHEMLNQAITKTVEVMSADSGAIRFLDVEKGDLVLASFQDFLPKQIPLVERHHLDPRILDWMQKFKKSMVFQNPARDPRLTYLGKSVDQISTLAVAPIRCRGETIGLIGISTIQPRELTTEDLNLLETIGHQIGVTMDREKLHQEALETERLAAIGRVATSVAHDLRSPLGGILRSTEFLVRPEISPATRQKMSKSVVSLARRLINTSQQILDYVQNDQLTSMLSPYKLTEFLNEVLSLLEIDFSDQGIELEKNLHYRGEVWLDGDRMAQVIYNIASNARDAMPGCGKFRVSTRQVGERVEMLFSDTGPGIPPNLEERIFEPFVSHGKRQGAGLGLSIAQRIVEEHGGTIRYKKARGWGDNFVISLPRHQ